MSANKDRKKEGFDPDKYPAVEKSLEDLTPDYDLWLKKDVWSIQEAVYLILNIDPNKSPYMGRYQELVERYVEILDLARIAEGRSLQYETASEVIDPEFDQFISGKVEPQKFVNWAHSKGYEIPELLSHLIDETENQGISKPISNEVVLKKIDQRVSEILLLAQHLFDDPMSIPWGGKAKMRSYLCASKPRAYSRRNLPLIPGESYHPFQAKPSTDSTAKLPPW